MVRFLHKLGDADRRPRRQDRLVAPPLGRARGGPPPHAKPMIMAMLAPPISPHTPYFTFAAVTGVIDYTSRDSTMAGHAPSESYGKNPSARRCSNGSCGVVEGEAERPTSGACPAPRPSPCGRGIGHC